MLWLSLLLGLLCAFIPLPIQMYIAAAICIFMRCNLPLAVATVWISNPLTFAPIFYLAYWVGALILGFELTVDEFTSESLSSELGRIWQPLLLGCLVCGVSFGLLAWFASSMAWRIAVVRRWTTRRSGNP